MVCLVTFTVLILPLDTGENWDFSYTTDLIVSGNSLFFTPSEDTPSIHTIYDSMLQNANHTYHSPELMMYMILELVSGTSYNSILYQQPVGLEELKPQLHQAVRGIFNQYRADEITDIPET